MFAIVDAEMSTSPRAPRCSRSADSGAFVSVNGTCAASLMRSTPSRGRGPGRCGYAFCTDHARVTVDSQRLRSPPVASAFRFVRNVPDDNARAQGARSGQAGLVGGLAGGRVREGAFPQDDLARNGDDPRRAREAAV